MKTKRSDIRGKKIDTNEWIIGYLIGNDVLVGNIVEFNSEYFTTEYWYKVDPKTVGRFIHQTDANKVYVYEGDILALKNIPTEKGMFIVKYNAKKSQFVLQDIHSPEMCFDASMAKGMVIIGNIHDNPEKLINRLY